MLQISIKKLRSLLRYNRRTGEFVRISSGYNKGQFVGKPAGTKRKNGYVVIRIDYKPYFAHRLAWAYCYGKWPDCHLDHKNRNPSDNRISNIRKVTVRKNAHNRKTRADSKLGIKGVRKMPNGTFNARIQIGGGRRLSLGIQKTAEDAAMAYDAAAIKYFGEYARTNSMGAGG